MPSAHPLRARAVSGPRGIRARDAARGPDGVGTPRGAVWSGRQLCVTYHLPPILTALKLETTSAARAGSVVTLSNVALLPLTVAPLIFRPWKAAPSSLIWSSIGVMVLPQAAAAPGMLEMALPPVAMSANTVLPSPATMAPSHEVIAASGVAWSTGPAVALVVPVSVAPVSSVVPDDIASDGVVALEVEPAGVGVAAGSTDFEQAASETERASASAPVRSFFMEGPCQTGGR